MNNQLLQQVFAAINGATITDMKEWKKFVSEAKEKMETRTTQLVDQQKKLLDDILLMQAEIVPQEANIESKPRGSYRLNKEMVLAAVETLLAEKNAVKVDDVMTYLVNGGFDGTRHSLKAHFDHLTKMGQLIASPDPDCKLHFQTNLYRKP